MTSFLQVTNNAKTRAVSGTLNNTTSPITLSNIDTTMFDEVTTGYAVTIWDDTLYADPGDDPNMERALVTDAVIDTEDEGSLTLSRPFAVAHTGTPRVALLLVSQNISDLNTAVNTLETTITQKQPTLVKTVGAAPADYVTDGTNDEVQINQAITDLNAAGGGKVYLKDTSYHVGTSPISLKNKVWIQGAGRASTIIYGGDTLGTNAVMLGSGTSIGSPLTDCIISDLTIDGTDMPTSPASTFRKGIDVIYTLRMRVFNVRIYKTPATGFGPDCNVDLQIDNCIFDQCGVTASNPGYNGLGIGTGAYANESCLVTNCIARGCYNNGFLLEYVSGGLNSKDFQFNNCYAYGNKRGFRVSGASGATFDSCKAVASTNEGFYIHMFGAALAYPQDIKIIACDSYNNGSDGIYIKDQEAQQTNHIIALNHVYSNTGDGIISGASATHIRSNSVHNNTKRGIYVHAFSSTQITSGQVKDNIVFNNGTAGTSGATDGIRIYGELGTIDGMQVTGNSCYDTQGSKTQQYAVTVKGILTNILVTGNDVRSYGTAAILNDISPASSTNQIFFNNGASDLRAPYYGESFMDSNRKRPLVFSDFIAAGTSIVDPFTAVTIASGTITTPNITMTAQHPGAVRIVSSTSTNSGGFIGSNTSQLLLGGGEVYEAVFYLGTLTTSTFWLGFIDSGAAAESVDGVYIGIDSSGVITGKTSSNSSRSSTGTTYTASASTWYRIRITINSSSSVTFTLYNDAGTVLWTDTLTTNIPTSSGRDTGVGALAYNSGTTAVTMIHLDYMALSYGTDRTR